MEKTKKTGPKMMDRSKALAYIVLGLSLGLIGGFAFGFYLSNRWNTEAFANQKTASGGAKPAAAEAPGQDNAMAKVFQHIETLRQQAVKEPKNAKPRIELGNMYFEVGKLDQAIEWYRQALEIEPNNVDARTDMATAYFRMGQADRAEAELQKSLAINPGHAHSMINLGIVKLQARNDRKTAQELWEKVIAMNPEIDPRNLDQVKQWVAMLKEGKNPLQR